MLGRLLSRRWIRLLGAALVLPLLILLVGAPATDSPVMPGLFEPTDENEDVAAELFVNLSGYLWTLGVALVAGSALLLQFRQRLVPDSVQWALAASAASAAMLSVFFGYRFQTDVATQISAYHLDLGAIGSRLELQAFLLMVSVSLLNALAVDRLHPRRSRARTPAKGKRDEP